MSQPTYVYEGIVERGSGTIRLAQLPADSAPVQFGVNGAITKHYGLDPMYIRFLGSVCVVLLLVAAAVAQESYDQVLHHWDYDKSAPLNIKQSGIEKRDGVTIYDISFSSPVGDRSAAVGPNGGKVTAYLVVPSGQGRSPAVIFGHWCMPGSEKKNRTEFPMKLSCWHTLGLSRCCLIT